MSLLRIVFPALFAAVALVAGAQTSGIDSTLVAKAAAGDAAAQVAVGEDYAAGKGVAQDLKQAADWYRKAAEAGNAAGQVHLAELYRDGRGVDRDKVQAAQWYGKAAEQGDAGAQGTLAVLYSVGQGVPQNYAEAYYWFDLAAAVESPKQQQYIANRQNMGAHITADELAAVQERAAKWKTAHPRPVPAR
ncbi:tetratricopeptide repeat protein [Terracidiphilus sp.]|uniref:tetratricopeptide repeat protein n=1 Tax=Terracidiphilus sp. TaxID=1964191 RepID=UPI003C27413B